MQLTRILRHLIAPNWLARRAFPRASLQAIELAVAAAEQRHAGELRFVVETGLPLAELLRDVSTRQRAVTVFSRLGVWDTEHNNGVLIYVQLIDRRVEIVADRGISAKVAQAEWDAVCRGMEAAFRANDYGRGALAAIQRIADLLAGHFPAQAGDKPNELSNRPELL